MFGHDDGGVRTKVLAELMHHMISLHGAAKEKNPEMHTSNATLPHPDGTPKHDPAGKVEGVSIVSLNPGGHAADDTRHKPLSSVSPDLNEHGGEGEHVEEHDLGDIFGRKHKGHSEYF